MKILCYLLIAQGGSIDLLTTRRARTGLLSDYKLVDKLAHNHKC